MSQINRYTCEEVFRRLDDYLDRELTPEEMQLVREHLEVCVACASEFRFEESVVSAMKDKVKRLAVPADLWAKITCALSQR